MTDPAPIKFDITNFQGKVKPSELPVDPGEHKITWKLPSKSPLRFADPPVAFLGPLPLPFKKGKITEKTATYTDNNNNSVGDDQDYFYQLRLIAGDVLIIWPASEVAFRGPTPIIRNRPSKKIPGSSTAQTRKRKRIAATNAIPRGRRPGASRKP